MPLNLTKEYNILLEIDHMVPRDRIRSLKGVFNRDFVTRQNHFKGKLIEPTPQNGQDSMEVLFGHLTTEIVDKKSRSRDFDTHRSKRLHWVRYHLNERNPYKIEVFSCQDKHGLRTYIYDEDEQYVIILEPLKDIPAYYLLTAYHLRGKSKYRIKNKMERKLDEIL